MAADRDEHPQRRRFITRQHVEDAHASGQPIRVVGRDVVTHEAAQRAADLGVRIDRPSRPGSTATSAAAAEASTADVRRAVRAAVIAELGTEPGGLDAAIDRVLAHRPG